MEQKQKDAAHWCLKAAEEGTATFPQIIGTLLENGFEGYAIDYRRGTATYFLGDNQSVAFDLHKIETPVALAFDAPTIQAAIKEAQQQAPGYTYKGFCEKAAAAGCAGYIVSFPGRRVLYYGRTAETHTEYFPN